MATHVTTHEITVALAGNPNVGKTTLFNALTGLKQKVANYPGVTVERKEGRCVLVPGGGASADLDTGLSADASAEANEPTRPHPPSIHPQSAADSPPSTVISPPSAAANAPSAARFGNVRECTLIDLPGTYSLASRSPDEHVARQVVLGQMVGTPRPDVIIVVADASNLERNLYLVSQVLELGRPTVVALSMMDIAEQNGKRVDVDKLSAHLRVPVVAVQAHKGKGIDELKRMVAKVAARRVEPLDLPLPEIMETHIERLQKILAEEKLSPADMTYFDAHLMLSTGDDDDVPDVRRNHPKIRAELSAALAACEQAQVDPISAEIEAHYAYIGAITHDVVHDIPGAGQKQSRTDRMDRVLTHKIFGMGIFVVVMGLVFVSIFWVAQPIMDFLQKQVVGGAGNWIGAHMAEGPLRSLMVDGIIAGVGNVVVFLPQIALLFFFLALLEDSGYMSRAAFLMDRVMSKVGLHGKSFIPMLSGYACAVPAIMGTRVIENRRDRLATIMVLPLMSCSARLPVYALVIATFFAGSVWIKGGILLAMYALGTLTAFGMAWVFKRTLLRGPAPAFILEMPPYRLPHWKVVGTTVVQRSWQFLKRAGTIIFAFSVIMWAATHYPKPATYTKNYDSEISQRQVELEPLQKLKDSIEADKGRHGDMTIAASEKLSRLVAEVDDLKNAQSSEVMENSTAGRVGKFIAPVFKPLGYDWKLSIGVTGAFFAREVIVSTLGIVYSVGEADEESEALQHRIRTDYTPLVGISLMVFVVFCMQCLSTLTIVKKETGTWGWPVFMFVYMTGLAWVAAFIVFQGGQLLGFK